MKIYKLCFFILFCIKSFNVFNTEKLDTKKIITLKPKKPAIIKLQPKKPKPKKVLVLKPKKTEKKVITLKPKVVKTQQIQIPGEISEETKKPVQEIKSKPKSEEQPKKVPTKIDQPVQQITQKPITETSDLKPATTTINQEQITKVSTTGPTAIGIFNNTSDTIIINNINLFSGMSFYNKDLSNTQQCSLFVKPQLNNPINSMPNINTSSSMPFTLKSGISWKGGYDCNNTKYLSGIIDYTVITYRGGYKTQYVTNFFAFNNQNEITISFNDQGIKIFEQDPAQLQTCLPSNNCGQPAKCSNNNPANDTGQCGCSKYPDSSTYTGSCNIDWNNNNPRMPVPVSKKGTISITNNSKINYSKVTYTTCTGQEETITNSLRVASNVTNNSIIPDNTSKCYLENEFSTNLAFYPDPGAKWGFSFYSYNNIPISVNDNNSIEIKNSSEVRGLVPMNVLVVNNVEYKASLNY